MNELGFLGNYLILRLTLLENFFSGKHQTVADSLLEWLRLHILRRRHLLITLYGHVVDAICGERELTFTFTICRRPSVCRPSVCRLSVCLSVTVVHPTQAIEIFGNVLRHLVRRTSTDFEVKFYGDRPRGTPPSGA